MDEHRLKKVQDIRSKGGIPYAAKFDRSHTLSEAHNLSEGNKTSISGRIVLFREMGKMAFATLQDHSGRMQISFKVDDIGEGEFKKAMSLLDLGDFVGVSGETFLTKKGEPTVQVSSWELLSKALRQPPEKWHGVQDQETAWRQRYLDILSNKSTMDRFKFRSDFVKNLREFYWDHDFTEVETPILVNAASGALATPFTTHHEAYDIDVFLRIAPEIFLKECLVGGFDRVFEVARCFRNEGLDPSHLQDFTMCEHYSAYWDYEKNMEFTEQMLSTILKTMTGSTIVKIPDRDNNLIEVDFSPPWPRISIRDAIEEGCGIDIETTKTADDLRAEMGANNIKLEVAVDQLGRGNLIDQLYKKVSRPSIVQPTFLTKHPIELSPLARLNDDNPSITDRFQLVVGGWEIVNAYSELIDPVDQAQRFEDQAKAHAGGDDDAHDKDDEYVKCLEYGCPPASGWGMGIDRITALLTQQNNIREVVLFPLMKPNQSAEMTIDSTSIENPFQKTTMSNDQLLLQHADYNHLLPAAHGLIEQHADVTTAHLLATGAAMEALAEKFGGNKDTWRVAGMLHDLDWDSLDKDFEKHCGEELEKMLATIDAPNELLGDIRAHYQERYGAEYPLDTILRKCLYCVDELTGFIIAVTLVRPSKQITDVEVKSVKKKLKDKGFAAQVSREQIKSCEELLDMPLDELIEITLNAMKNISSDLKL